MSNFHSGISSSSSKVLDLLSGRWDEEEREGMREEGGRIRKRERERGREKKKERDINFS